MRHLTICTFFAAIVTAAVNAAHAAPVVLGLTNKHPLTEVEAGELLIGELRCAACHGGAEAWRGKDSSPWRERAAPDLTDVGGRVAPEYLRRFIASPSTAHAGTTMPDLLADKSPAERDKIAEALTHFLVAQSPHKFERETAGADKGPSGKDLFHSVGCIACHSPRDGDGNETTHAGVVELNHVPAKYSPKSLSAFLYQPLRVRPSGRMPDMKLTPPEGQAIASYLIGPLSADAKPAEFKPDDKLAAEGKQYFQDLNCAACHTLEKMPPPKLEAGLGKLDFTRGCLSHKPSGKSPRFNLSDEQAKAITAAIEAKRGPVTPKMQLATTLTAFNCIACHERDNYGGVSNERNLLFQTSEKNLGDDARIPPPLTLLGAKLQTAWLKKVLFDGESVRPYMFTRMPQFGEPNLRDLPDVVAKLDTVKEVDLKIPKLEGGTKEDHEREKLLRPAGRELLGDKGLYCIACHNFNGKPSPNNKGIDLMTTTERLQPSWYYHFLIEPIAYRPRIVMPVSWPGGKAVHKTILGGNTDDQIAAIWYYLSLGTSAADPPGIRGVETKIAVTDAARTYRGRSSVAGFRGIAVGFPQRLSYAFNAETGTLTALWHGEFIRVDRSGQGSGGFNPAAHHVQLAQDISFFELPDETAPWPLRPTMTKEAPVNPDPLYPKNRGYQFKGYYMDDASIPTFMYRSGDIEIEDRSAVESAGEKGRLLRTFTFNAPRAETIWFRALTGKIEAEAKEHYKNAEVRITVPPGQAVLRELTVNDKAADKKDGKGDKAPEKGADKNVSELLLKLDIPQGKSTAAITYELLQ